MNILRVYSIFLRQIFLILSNPVRLVSHFMWLVIDIILWGFITKYLSASGQANFDFIAVLLGAIILWEFASRIQTGTMTSFLEDIWSQNFINFFASPLQIKEYLGGLVLTSTALGLLGFLLMLLIAGVAFGYNIFILGFYILPFIFLLFCFGVAMGLFVTAIIFRLGPSAEWLGWPIPMILSIFSGVFYPISTLPGYLQIFAKILPPSYVFESVRALLSSGVFTQALWNNLFFAFALSLIYLFLTYRLFVKVYRHNLKTGALSRFSAEAQ